ncbi:MAG: hypothetical protein C5B59_08115 [Bacteroidetes bacterium]|nr:MAG: hypothetical protein C5B59_08115 [Bacteroidota bacterium]
MTWRLKKDYDSPFGFVPKGTIGKQYPGERLIHFGEGGALGGNESFMLEHPDWFEQVEKYTEEDLKAFAEIVFRRSMHEYNKGRGILVALIVNDSIEEFKKTPRP